MDATELSDDRVMEIQKAVGRPSTSKPSLPSTLCEPHSADPVTLVSPDEYLAKLKHEIGSEELLDQFLEKSCRLHREERRVSAEEWLKQLTAVDFRDVATISEHHFALTLYKVGRFDLGTNGVDTFAVAGYSGALYTQEAELPPLSPSVDIESGNYHAHPSLISLHKGEVSLSHPGPVPSETGAVTASRNPLPSLVMPIGQLQKKSKEEDDDDYVNTDYVLVIDATKPNHPVWLIYERNAEDDLGEPHAVHPDEQPLVFKELGKNFDAMQVFPGIQEWLDSWEDIDFAHMLKVMQAIGSTGPIQAKEIALSEAQKLVSK
ncbi:hypothetical protein F52700_8348 [Fusarium sp. NRRL 52700]|nr:hypothetical protein F52700_8348 [Fusarium sp. NRRL 52700]